jgi:protein-disulfide isomerase
MSKNVVLFRAFSTLAVLWLAAGSAWAQALPARDEILADRVMGEPAAPVTLTEYASLTCPHCASFHKDTLPTIKKDYIDTGKVKLLYKDFPLDRLALTASMMARCAPKERYFGLLETLFRTQDTWTRSADPSAQLQRLGQVAGLSKEGYDACVNNKEIFDGLMAQRGAAESKVGSTPTFYLGDKRLTGAVTVDVLRKELDQALAAQQKK